MDKEKLGDKIRAGRILSETLRKILQEKTIAKNDDGDFDTMTKAEALVRGWVKCALGYEETVDIETVDSKGDVCIKQKKIIHPPDRVYGQLIADRVEGRVATTVEADSSKRPTAAKKVSQLNKDRLNRIAKDAADR